MELSEAWTVELNCSVNVRGRPLCNLICDVKSKLKQNHTLSWILDAQPNFDVDSLRIGQKNTIYLTSILGQTLDAYLTESVQPQGQLTCLQTGQNGHYLP
jgi:hypothetical protein